MIIILLIDMVLFYSADSIITAYCDKLQYLFIKLTPNYLHVLCIGGDISLTNARLELLTNGTNVYICEGTSSTLLEFTWDVRMSGPRVPLLSDNPNTLYVIVTNVDSTISPIVGSSRIYFDPNSVNFEDVECVIRNEMGSLLRVRTSEFIPVPIGM